MSVRVNIIANYASQLYVIAISIAVVPFYLRAMGTEAFGLVGFFTTLTAWFMLLDLGLTPTVAREIARFRGGAIEPALILGLFRHLERIFLAIGIVALAAMLALSNRIATHWLNPATLPPAEVNSAVALMAVTIPIRWMSSLYRSAIIGFERQVWLAAFSMLVATARFAGALLVVLLVSAAPRAFFTFHLLVAVVELTILLVFARRQLPPKQPGKLATPAGEIRRMLSFSAGIAFTGAVWVLITQVDKLLLSTLLPLADYGYFTIAVLLAGGITTFSIPLSQAILPGLTRLSASNDAHAMLGLYRRATQLVCVIIIPIALCMATFSEAIIWAWTGDVEAVRQVSLTLSLYALGNGLMAVAALAYFLQYAKGDLRLHIIGNLLLLLIFVPALIWATRTYGMVGAGAAWLTSIAAYLLVWLPVIHHRLSPGLNPVWWTQDVLPVVCASAMIALILWPFSGVPDERWAAAFLAVTAGTLMLTTSALASPIMRAELFATMRRLRLFSRR